MLPIEDVFASISKATNDAKVRLPSKTDIKNLRLEQRCKVKHQKVAAEIVSNPQLDGRHKKSTQPIRCSHCNMQPEGFRDGHALRRHLQEKHPDLDLNYRATEYIKELEALEENKRASSTVEKVPSKPSSLVPKDSGLNIATKEMYWTCVS